MIWTSISLRRQLKGGFIDLTGLCTFISSTVLSRGIRKIRAGKIRMDFTPPSSIKNAQRMMFSFIHLP
jgi:hypothetical protein